MHGWSSRRNLLEGSVALNFSYLESARARHSWNMSHENMSWKLRFSALEICLLHYAFFSWTLGTPNAALATVWSGHPREEDVGSGFLCRYSPRPPFGAWICSVQSENATIESYHFDQQHISDAEMCALHKGEFALPGLAARWVDSLQIRCTALEKNVAQKCFSEAAQNSQTRIS